MQEKDKHGRSAEHRRKCRSAVELGVSLSSDCCSYVLSKSCSFTPRGKRKSMRTGRARTVKLWCQFGAVMLLVVNVPAYTSAQAPIHA